MLDLQKLKTFRAVADSSSFTRAALELGCSQSSVTAHVQALEREFGALLFDRDSKRVLLTAIGKQTLDYADRILALADEAKAAVHKSKDLNGSLAVSAPEALVAYRLPEVLREFQELYPQVHLTLSTHADSSAQAGDLLNGKLDLAFAIGQAVRSDRLSATFVASEEVLLVAAPGYISPAAELTLEDIGRQQILLTGQHCSFRRLFDQMLHAARFQLNSTLELASMEAIKQCALAGMGLAVVPRMAVAAELVAKKLVALPWPDGELRAQVQILRLRKRIPEPATHAFSALAERVLSAAF